MTIENIRILGVAKKPSKVTINKKKAQVNYVGENNVLILSGLRLNLLRTFKVQWS